jgi:hypothetical protein
MCGAHAFARTRKSVGAISTYQANALPWDLRHIRGSGACGRADLGIESAEGFWDVTGSGVCLFLHGERCRCPT